MLLMEGTAASAAAGSTAMSSLEERFLQACKVGDIETVREEAYLKAYRYCTVDRDDSFKFFS
jgi:hypothetical protein